MSLILEALKKLDREKQAPDRGLLVVGPSSWPSEREGRSPASAGVVVMAALALAALAGGVWLSRSPKTPAPAGRPAAAPAASRTPLPAPVPVPVPTPAQAAFPRPPVTLPSAATPVKAPKASPAESRFQLQAISQQDGQPVAVLNDRLVREGDTFDGVRVLRIGADEVEIEVAGRRRLVKF